MPLPLGLKPSQFIDRVAILSGVAPPVLFTGADIDAMLSSSGNSTGEPGVLDIVKPTIIIKTNLRQQPYVIAPNGVSGPDDYKSFQRKLLLGGLAIAVGFTALGFMLGRRRRDAFDLPAPQAIAPRAVRVP